MSSLTDIIEIVDNNLSRITYDSMYRRKMCSNIQHLLLDCFGKARTSKALAYERKTTKKYYFKLDNENEILNFIDILNKNLTIDEKKTFKEKKELYNYKYNEKDKLPLCARYDETRSSKNNVTNDPGFVVEIYTMLGIRYHRINNSNKIGASIILSNSPVIVLESSKVNTFFGIFNDVSNTDSKQQTEGLLYWINKFVFLHDNFKRFISNLFRLVGEEGTNYILKDIGRTIMQCGCFLPEVSYKQLLDCYTPKDIINKTIGNTEGIKINYNKYDVNVSYLLAKIYRYIHNNDYRIILNMKPEIINDIVSYYVMFNGLNDIESIKSILERYYIKILNLYEKEFDVSREHYLIKDYIKQSIELGEKISLNLTYRQLEQKHDEVTRDYLQASTVKNIDIVMKPSIFDVVDTEFEGIANIRRLITDNDLYSEGENQHNCVYSRKSLIELDRAAVYHWDYNDESITVQINAKGNRYWIEEMRARFNADCSLESKVIIEQIIRNLNDTLLIHWNKEG